MDKKLQALLLGGFIASAGFPLTASAQTPSTATPYSVTESAPFTENWSGVGALLSTDVWTVEDKNNDNYTWEDLGTGTPAYNGANASQTADDWLVSPPLYLQAGTSYTLETGGFCGVFSGAAQRLEVAFGTGDDPATYDQFIAPMPITGYTLSTGATPVKGVFTPTTTGNYRIGFHAISEQPGYLILSSVRVSVTANTAGTPVKVSDLTLKAGDNAEPTVKVSFTAPTKDITNRDLTALTSCTVYRDDSTLPVYTFTAPTPGAQLEWTDENVTEGNHAYAVYSTVDDLRSEKAEASVYVGGEETPGTPQNVVVYDNLDGTITLKWDAVTTGLNGGYITPSKVKYAIFEGIYQEALYDGITDTQFTITDIPLTGSQQYKFYQVVAYFDEEHIGGTGFAEPFFYGTPYGFPFKESWPYGAWENGPWSASYNDTKSHFKISTNSADDDEGSVMFTPAKGGDEASFVGPKIAMGKATNARLSFQYYAYPGSKSKIQVYLDVNGQKMKLASEVDYSTLEGKPGWRTVNVDCDDPDFKKENGYGRVFFHAISDGENIMVDDININDAIDYNVITTMDAPLHAMAGDDAEVTVHVRNVGLETAEGFEVKLYANDAVVATTESGVIEPGETKDYTLVYNVPFYSKEAQVWAEADWANDENQDNNVTDKATIKTVNSVYAGITDLKAEKKDNGIELTWTNPATENETVTESFEIYDPFSTDEIEPWTLYDADRARTTTFGGISFPGNGTAYAYTVFNCDGTTHGMDAETFARFKQRFGGRTGDQAMMSFGNVGDAANGNNDWLISPELSGKAQTVDFYIKAPQCDGQNYGAEDFYVAYSTTDTEVNHFTTVLEGKADDNINWKHVTVDLPEGAKYFAIVHTSTVPLNPTGYDPAAILVDDVTFESAPHEIAGYGIFRNNMLIDLVETGAMNSYTDKNGTEEDKYHVLVAYEDEAFTAPSNTASADPTGINSTNAVAAQDAKMVYTTTGALVGNSTAKLPAGIYIVKQGDNVQKVVVK